MWKNIRNIGLISSGGNVSPAFTTEDYDNHVATSMDANTSTASNVIDQYGKFYSQILR